MAIRLINYLLRVILIRKQNGVYTIADKLQTGYRPVRVQQSNPLTSFTALYNFHKFCSTTKEVFYRYLSRIPPVAKSKTVNKEDF